MDSELALTAVQTRSLTVGELLAVLHEDLDHLTLSRCGPSHVLTHAVRGHRLNSCDMWIQNLRIPLSINHPLPRKMCGCLQLQ